MAAVPAPASETRTQRLNFVFILIDDVGCKNLGCYGSSGYQTPHIDRLAATGMRFTNAYAAWRNRYKM